QEQPRQQCAARHDGRFRRGSRKRGRHFFGGSAASHAPTSLMMASLAAASAAAPPLASALAAGTCLTKFFCARSTRPSNSDARIATCAVLLPALVNACEKSSASRRSTGRLIAPSDADTTTPPARASDAFSRCSNSCAGGIVHLLAE